MQRDAEKSKDREMEFLVSTLSRIADIVPSPDRRWWRST
jgi:hypothetical protein